MAEPRDAIARLEALLGAQGQEVLAWLAGQAEPAGEPGRTGRPGQAGRAAGAWPGGHALRLSAILRQNYPAGLVADALAQHELRLRARAKFERAMSMYFTRPGLEQASSEPVARHRAARYAGARRVADLCCGIGGDLIALAGGHPVVAVDHDPLHVRIAAENAAAYGVAARVTGVARDVREVGLAGQDAVFVDPARRTAQRRLRPGDSEPPLRWCLGLAARVAAVAVKAAPGIAREAVPPGWELEFIAAGRELKEAVLWSPALATATTRATVLPGGHTLASQAPAAAAGAPPPVPARMPGEFLLDPNPAVTRAGLVEDLARLTGAWKIDPKIAFLSADAPVATPFARTLRVIDSGPWKQKQLPARLRALGIGAVDIRRRGLAGDVGGLHRRLKLSGPRRATLVMTRVRGQPWALVCLDLPAGG